MARFSVTHTILRQEHLTFEVEAPDEETAEDLIWDKINEAGTSEYEPGEVWDDNWETYVEEIKE